MTTASCYHRVHDIFVLETTRFSSEVVVIHFHGAHAQAIHETIHVYGVSYHPHYQCCRLTFATTGILIFRVFLVLLLCRLVFTLPLCGFDATGGQVKKLWIFVVVQMREKRIEPIRS
jgi:hypothetical protein